MTPTYEMFTPKGNAAVHRHIVVPALAEAEKPGLPINVRARCAETVKEGIAKIMPKHPEVFDTAVRECIYGAVGKVLVEKGYADDRWNWDN
jgi:hypothetical protein